MSLTQYGLVGLRKSWPSSHDECLLELLIDQKNCGKTTSNLFKYEVYKTVTENLNQKFGTNVDENQIKLRYNALKKDYGVIKTLLGQPGFHWEGQKQMVVADGKVWENYIAVRRDARPYRWRSFPLYDKMSIIFEDSVVGDAGARNLPLPSRVNKTLEEVNSDPETVQVLQLAIEPSQFDVDAHYSDSSFNVNKKQPGKSKSTTSGRKRSAHVEGEDFIENAFNEKPSADRFTTMQKNVNVPHYRTRRSVFVALDESPTAVMSKGMQKNVNEPQCKKRKSNSVATSGYRKRLQVDLETVQVLEPAIEPSQFDVDAHDSDSSFHVNKKQLGKSKSTTSGRKRSAHVQGEDSIENAFDEIPSADRFTTMQKNVNVPHYTTRKSVLVATFGQNKSPQVEAVDSIENALDESPSAVMSKGMQKNVNEPQCKKRKSNSVATSVYKKRLQVKADDSIENALEEIPSAARSKGAQENLNDARALYQKCLDELQIIDEFDDSEFSKAVCALKDDKNAIAFMTIRGPRRLIWLRSILDKY